MQLNKVKKPERRFDTAYYSTLGIQSYGKDNLYPQQMQSLVDNSPTGSTCVDRYERFMVGGGFKDETLAEFVCNHKGDTANDILRLVCKDVAHFHGFALHLNYDIMGRVCEVQHVPFDQCRLEEEDDDGRVAYINLHPDWSGRKRRRGKTVKVNKSTVDKIAPFNPHRSVVFDQMMHAGGVDRYKGQVMWYSLDGNFIYPKPKYDKVVTELSIDEGLDNVKYRNVRNNFLVSGVLVHKKGASGGLGVDENGQPIEDEDDDDDFSQTLDEFQGDTNACSIMDITVNSDEDVPSFMKFEPENFDKKYDSTERSTTERIYAAFEQEVFYSIRIGKVGFSGSIVSDAFDYYNSCVANVRSDISRQLKKVFDLFGEEACPSGDYEIKPLAYLSKD